MPRGFSESTYFVGAGTGMGPCSGDSKARPGQCNLVPPLPHWLWQAAAVEFRRLDLVDALGVCLKPASQALAGWEQFMWEYVAQPEKREEGTFSPPPNTHSAFKRIP